MLQQTQVSRVVPKYELWIDAWPDTAALAAASLQDVLARWSGLGYNNRAKRLRNAAQQIEDDFDGVFPTTIDALEQLPGVGPYTARAVKIFAFNDDVVTVDTNIRRILIHEFGLDEDVSDDELYALAEELLPEGRSREWHNALMDYGALEATSHATGIGAASTQSSFEGSRRQFRGKIVRALTDGPVAVDDLDEAIDSGEVDSILADLEEEGMVVRADGMVRFAD
jgi:A/G-specific adenine glycosylase